MTEIDQIVVDEDGGKLEKGPLTPPPGATAIVRQGDIFVLGEHRIICGNSADPTFSSIFPKIENSMSENPVTLRPGRARPSTAPDAIGSLVNATTTGIERVKFVTTGMTRLPTITMTSGFSATRFAASAFTKSMLLVDHRSSN
jgi:hypothetical protein